MYFSEIIKLQFGEKCHTFFCILSLFRILVAHLSLKNVWLPAIFFKDSNSPYKDMLLPHSDETAQTYFFISRHCPLTY